MNYSRSLIIGTLITMILAILRMIKKFQVPRLLGFFIYDSSQYHNPDNQGLGFFSDYWDFFLDLLNPIIKDLLYSAFEMGWDTAWPKIGLTGHVFLVAHWLSTTRKNS